MVRSGCPADGVLSDQRAVKSSSGKSDVGWEVKEKSYLKTHDIDYKPDFIFELLIKISKFTFNPFA